MKNWNMSLLLIGIVVLFSMNLVSAFDWSDTITGYYKLDETVGAVVSDIFAQQNLTATGTYDWIGGKINNGFNLSLGYGTGDIEHNYTLGGNNWSISMWIYPHTVIGSQLLVINNKNWAVRLADDEVSFSAIANTSDAWHQTPLTTSADLVAKDWYHIVVTYNGSTDSTGSGLKIYVNNTLHSHTASWQPNSIPKDIGDGTFWVGGTTNLSDGYPNQYYNGTLDEIGIWNRTLSATDITELYASGSGLGYGNSSGKVSLYSPADALLTDQEDINFTANYTSSIYQWINGTYYLWNANNTIYQIVTVGVTGLINSTIQNFSNIPVGNYIWNVYGCYDKGVGVFNCTWDPSNRTLIVNGKVNAIGYSTQTYQTQTEGFTIEVHIPAGMTITLPKLFYNGVNYSATSTENSATSYNFSKSLGIPIDALGNKSFKWFWQINSINFSSDTYYQQVNETILTLCNATYVNPFLNITFKDEADLSIINATIDSSTFKYWLGNGYPFKTYTFSNTTLNWDYAFCGVPNETINNNISIQYASTGYAQRRVSLSTDLTNTTLNKVLYLLSLADGIYSVYQVQDQNGNQVSGVSATAERLIDGVWILLESGTTDSAGAVTFWLNPNYDHRLTFIKTTYRTETVIIRPSSSTYSVVMTTGAGTSEYNGTLADGVSWKAGIVPFANILAKNTEYTWWFWVNSTTANLVAYKMELLDNKSNVLATVIGTGTAGSNITITLNTMTNKSIRSRYSIDSGGGYVIVDADAFWRILDYNPSERGTIHSFIKYLNRVNIFGEEEGRVEYSKALLFFIILFMVLGAICFSSGWDFATTGGGIMLLYPIVLIASLAGFFNISYLPAGAEGLATGSWLQKYTVALIAGALSVSYALNKLAEGKGK